MERRLCQGLGSGKWGIGEGNGSVFPERTVGQWERDWRGSSGFKKRVKMGGWGVPWEMGSLWRKGEPHRGKGAPKSPHSKRA